LGASKTSHFSAEQNNIAIIAKALGHPARVAIIEYLLQVNACICGDIVNVLPLAQPTVSQHLKELKNAGLIQGQISGNAICYCINKEAFTQLQAFFQPFLFSTTNNAATCC